MKRKSPFVHVVQGKLELAVQFIGAFSTWSVQAENSYANFLPPQSPVPGVHLALISAYELTDRLCCVKSCCYRPP